MYDKKIRNIKMSTFWNLSWLKIHHVNKIPNVTPRIAKMYKEDIAIIKKVFQMEPTSDKEYNRVNNRFRQVKRDEEAFGKYRSP